VEESSLQDNQPSSNVNGWW